jgi:hypothetical protein
MGLFEGWVAGECGHRDVPAHLGWGTRERGCGRRDVPAHLGSVRLAEPRPILGVGAEVFHDGVLPEVVRFEFELVVIADAMVEESVLPFDVVGSFVPAFPVVHDGGHGCYARKCDEGVHVVGHQHEKKTAPPMARVIKVGGVEERASEGRCAER